MPKVDSNYICLAVKLIDSALKIIRATSALREYKYTEKEKKGVFIYY